MNKYILWLLLMPLFAACVSETDIHPEKEGGQLRLSLGNLVTTVTRSTPEEIGKPNPSDFSITVADEAGTEHYSGAFDPAEEDGTMMLKLAEGNYRVKAEYGKNELLAIDAPYYIGEASVSVVKNVSREVSLTCEVGNALVSAVFGKDEADKDRFDSYFSDYKLQVGIGVQSESISSEQPEQSIYVRADQQVSLTFVGHMKDSGEDVSYPLTLNGFDGFLRAKDHAKVTLTIAAGGLTVEIHKLEMEELTVGNTIPLSWLPKPEITFEHQYNGDGELVGTNFTLSDAYKGLTWGAEIYNTAGEKVRELTGTGVLQSLYTESTDWPYLLEGEAYKARFYYITSESEKVYINEENELHVFPKVVPAPNLTLTVEGYTNYDTYLQSGADAANAQDGRTVFSPTVHVNISNELMANPNYSTSLECNCGDISLEVPADIKNNIIWNSLESLPVKEYLLKSNMTFAGTMIQGQKILTVTGLPVDFNPPKEETGWTRSGKVTFNSTYVQLGQLGTGSQSITNSSAVYIPIGTMVALDFKLGIWPASMGTTFTVTDGDSQQTFCSEREGAYGQDGLFGGGGTKEYPHEKTVQTLVTDKFVTQLKCNNSYGAGQTHTKVYRLYFKYAN